MTVGEIMDSLILAENYLEVRVTISDEFMEMAKNCLSSYRFIKEKEENYQEIVKTLKG